MRFDRYYQELLESFDTVSELVLEFSEKAIQNIIKKFQNEANENEIRREVADFEKFKNALQKKDPFQYKSWIEFTEAIHAAKGKAEFKKKKFSQKEITANQEDIIADDENVTIYKGDSQDKCVMYGVGYSFCISRKAGGNMYSSYRMGQHSTFYFIYFKKIPKTDPKHIMVLDSSNNGYLWTFADNNTQMVDGGIDEVITTFPELKKYKKLFINNNLTGEEVKFKKIADAFDLSLRHIRYKIISDEIPDEANIIQMFKLWKKLSYKDKITILQNSSLEYIPNELWAELDPTQRNEFLSAAPNLTHSQAKDMKPNEISRYKKVRNEFFTGNGHAEDIQGIGRDIQVNMHDDLENVLSDPLYAMIYAMDLEGVGVPSEVEGLIASVPEYAKEYVRFIMTLPIGSYDSVSDDIFDATDDGGLDDEEMIEFYRKIGRYPPEDEYEESSKFDRQYYQILEEISS